jgi:hypothetical protein
MWEQGSGVSVEASPVWGKWPVGRLKKKRKKDGPDPKKQCLFQINQKNSN